MFKKLPDILEIHPTGSSYICDPPVKNTDEDFICLIGTNNIGKFIIEMGGHGWVSDTSYPGTNFTSLRRNNINYIITNNIDFYKKFVLATKIAKKLDLRKKEDRIILFQGVLYDNVPEITDQ